MLYDPYGMRAAQYRQAAAAQQSMMGVGGLGAASGLSRAYQEEAYYNSFLRGTTEPRETYVDPKGIREDLQAETDEWLKGV